MRFLTTLLILFFFACGGENQWQVNDDNSVEINDGLSLKLQPIQIGINIGKEVDQLKGQFDAIPVQYIRFFELQGDAYPDYTTPATASPVLKSGDRWKFTGS